MPANKLLLFYILRRPVFRGKWFNIESYGVRSDNELIDYDELRDKALASRPKMICSGATAYPSLIDF